MNFDEQLTPSQLSEFSKKFGLSVDLSTVNIAQHPDPLALLEEIRNCQIIHIPWGLVNLVHNEITFEGPPPLDIRSIFKLLVVENKEGFCFSVNRLLLALIQGVGFDCYPILGTVVLNPATPREIPNHLAVCVKLNNKLYLCDAGMGFATPDRICPIDNNTEGTDEKITKISGTQYAFHKKLQGEMKEALLFDIAEKKMDPELFKKMNKLHTDSDGPFSRFLAITKGTKALTSEHLITPSGMTPISTLEDFKRELKQHFEIDLAPEVKLTRCFDFFAKKE